jgi:hypothetical protein
MSATFPVPKDSELNWLVAEYLAKGGRITNCPPGVAYAYGGLNPRSAEYAHELARPVRARENNQDSACKRKPARERRARAQESAEAWAEGAGQAIVSNAGDSRLSCQGRVGRHRRIPTTLNAPFPAPRRDFWVCFQMKCSIGRC